MKLNTMTQKRWVNTTDLNTKGILFGGKLLTWADEDASLLVADSIPQDFVTGRVFNAEFKAPAKAGDILTFYYSLVHLSHATITVKTEVFDKHEEVIFSAYLSFVAVHGGAPTPISCNYDIPVTNDWRFVEQYRDFIKGAKNGACV